MVVVRTTGAGITFGLKQLAWTLDRSGEVLLRNHRKPMHSYESLKALSLALSVAANSRSAVTWHVVAQLKHSVGPFA